MRKTIVFTCLLMFVFGTSLSFATEDNPEMVTKDLLEKYQEMQYSTEAGITKVDYDRQYRDLYIATQKAQGKIPQETYDKFSGALKSYDNASTIWNAAGQVFKFKEIQQYLDNPGHFRVSMVGDVFGRYYKSDIVQYLFREANDKTRKLTEEI